MSTYWIQEGAGLYFLTLTVTSWLPVFLSEEPCVILTDSLNYCHENKNLRINAFVIMPTHVHLIVFDAGFDVERLRKTLHDLRSFTGRRLADYCNQQIPKAFNHVLKHSGRTDRRRQFWQPGVHPEGIFTARFWRTKVRYIHDNPRRKGFVRDGVAWRFSSASYWLL